MSPLIFTLTIQDAINATRLGFWTTYKSNMPKAIAIIAAIAATLALIPIFFETVTLVRYLTFFSYVFFIYIALYILFIPFCYYIIVPYRVRKQFKQMPSLSQEMQLSWTEKDFIFRSGKSVSEFPFADLHKWCANDESLTIFPTYLIHYMVPRRAFPDNATYNEFQSRLIENGVRRI